MACTSQDTAWGPPAVQTVSGITNPVYGPGRPGIVVPKWSNSG
mgnify:CR=1 FL=1